MELLIVYFLLLAKFICVKSLMEHVIVMEIFLMNVVSVMVQVQFMSVDAQILILETVIVMEIF